MTSDPPKASDSAQKRKRLTLKVDPAKGKAQPRANPLQRTVVVERSQAPARLSRTARQPLKIPGSKTTTPTKATRTISAQDGLSETEQQARKMALQRASSQTQAPPSIAERVAKVRREAQLEEEAHRSLQEEEQARRDEEDKRRRAEEAAKRRSEELAARQGADKKGKEAPGRDEVPGKTKKTHEPRRHLGHGGAERRQSRMTVTQILEREQNEERGRSMASIRRAREKQKNLRPAEQEKIIREVTIPERITVGDLANRMAEQSADVIKTLMKMGTMATRNQLIDADTAELVTTEMGHKVKRIAESDVEDVLTGHETQKNRHAPRPPVVTIMGHVDHGKTSLLDALRGSDVAHKEAGGITQHIGAYQVTTTSGACITFIDTPGHEAFTQMRARGTHLTDIVVLVVAADSGIQPQTIEAISHTKSADVPIIVALNKIDAPGADPQRIKTDLLSHDVQIEELGGSVLCVEVSALKRQGLEQLLEAIALQADIMDIKADPDCWAEGIVIEARVDRGRGIIITALIQDGNLAVGSVFLAGAEWGRVRALINDRGENIKAAGPGTPVEILGLQRLPVAGDKLIALDSEAQARQISEYRSRKIRDSEIAIAPRSTLDQMLANIREDRKKELPVIIKTDVHGTMEALKTALQSIQNDEVVVHILHHAVGGITRSDVQLALSCQGVIFGFNVRANPEARTLARQEKVDIRYYSVIYDLIDDIKQLVEGLLAPEERETRLGYAEVREVFTISKVGKVAGCIVTEGVIKRGSHVRIARDDVIIYTGTLKQLKRFKDNVREVHNATECGMAFERFDDLKTGDVIECFDVNQVARSLNA